MANDDLQRNELEEELIDDELCNLFSAFDEVSASDELVEATIARIVPEPANAAVPRRAKWRAIRVMALAACLALALGGGVAYATPASFYDVVQDGATVTLGVNCFGITVFSATSDDEGGEELLSSTDLRNVPYEESLSRAVEAMEERNPNAPIEFGMQGEEREVVAPAASEDRREYGDEAMGSGLERDNRQGREDGQPPDGDPGEYGRDGGNPAEPNRPGADQDGNGPAEGAGPSDGR